MHELKERASEENKHGYSAGMGEGFEEHLIAQIPQTAGCQNKEAEMMGFMMGWITPDENRKGAKSGKGRPSKAIGEKGKKVVGSIALRKFKKGQWANKANRPNFDAWEETQNMGAGPKHKTCENLAHREVDSAREKKLKVEKETKTLSMLFAAHLGSVEVDKQPRREQ